MRILIYLEHDTVKTYLDRPEIERNTVKHYPDNSEAQVSYLYTL